MEHSELERWLCGPEAHVPAPSAVAAALGLPAHLVADTTLVRMAGRVRSLRFILAVLHDTFVTDADLREWLVTPREELGGAAPREALVAGGTALVESLVVETWNARSCIGAA